jgi:hypothetical protein
MKNKNSASSAFSKKHLLTITRLFIVFAIFFLVHKQHAVGQEENLNVLDRWQEWPAKGTTLIRYINEQAFELLDKREKELETIKTQGEWLKRQKEISDILMNIIGPFPEKTPLHAKVVKVIEKENFHIEHIIFESQPGYYVTSSLFIPKNSQGKSPAVIYVPGHIENYRDSAYQLIILNLVARGFIVYAFDPVSLGERIQYYDKEKKESLIGRATSEHSYAGTQALISGISQARQMTWDGIRAIDYLFSRKEVDTTRVGMVGSSGGGTQTAYISSLDKRIYAAIPSNFLTSLRRLLQSIGPQDAEQNIYKSISDGIDHADLVTARAPLPTLILSSTRDFFSIQGTFETVEEIKRAYNAFGKPENFDFFHDDVNHDVTQAKREKMYDFFQNHLRNPGSSTEIMFKPIAREELQVTLTGQIASSFSAKNISDLTRNHAGSLAAKIQESRVHDDKHAENTLVSARNLSGYIEPLKPGNPVFTGRIRHEGYFLEKYFVKGKGNYPIPYLLYIPNQQSGKALLFLHPSGKSSIDKETIQWILNTGVTVMIPDLPGFGEMGPENQGRYKHMTELFAASLISKSVPGIHATDIVMLSRLLKEVYHKDEIFSIAYRELSPALLHAAAFEPEINRVLLYNPCLSYLSLATETYYSPHFISGIVPYALKGYDLPDLAATLAPRRFIVADAVDAKNEFLEEMSIKKEMSFIYSSYEKSGAGSQVLFLREKSGMLSHETILKLLD